MDIIVKITDSSSNTGPTFNLYSNVDNYTTAFVTNVSKASLLSGYYTNLAPANTVTVRVKSVGSTCNSYIDVSVLPPTTTTTTTYPVTVDFTLEILTNYLYANPAVLSYQYTGAPSGKYAITAQWASTKEQASDPYFYSAIEYPNWTYFYGGGNIPPTNNGFPPGTYWFGVRDFDNYLNMKVKSITILPSTTTTTTTAPTLTPILVYINFTSGSTLCTNPTSEASLTVYCTTSTLQANSKTYYSNGTNSPAANGLYVSAGLVSGVPGPVFRVIDNAGTLAAHNCSTTTTTTTII